MNIRKAKATARMKIVRAEIPDFESVKRIAQATIRSVYPRYYPSGAVDFFARHHSGENIARDIAAGKVYLLKVEDVDVGTVTVNENEIARLFVLPEYQHRGYGRSLMDFAENMIFQADTEITLDASLPAKQIYKKRGYVEVAYHTIRTENGDFLCYDVMQKKRYSNA